MGLPGRNAPSVLGLWTRHRTAPHARVAHLKSQCRSPVLYQATLGSLADLDQTQQPLPKAELTSLFTAASITAREQHVLQWIAAGLTNREIATQLSIAESTVKTHLENIYHKLGVNSRTQAVRQAQVLKLV